jgi:RHS repeat-associated protein
LKFGKLQRCFTYNADGTIDTATDGRNHKVTLSNWFRGIPRLIRHPDNTTESAVVNAAGWITARTSEAGFTTGYGYDAAGRLASIVHPSGDTVTWNNWTSYFRPLSTADWKPQGIATGQWHRVEWKGNDRKITYFDTLWRPVAEVQYDEADVLGTRQSTRTVYDASGRVSFRSYPSAQVVPPDQGEWTTYDAIGRSKSVSQDSEHGLLTTLTEYLPGFQTRTTNPRGAKVISHFMAWDKPDYGLMTYSLQPEGKVVEISRHPQFGWPLQLKQRSADNGVQISRYYAYDGAGQLCKTIEPETGATVMGYDDAGNLAWSAAGHHDLTSTNSCNHVEGWSGGRRVDRSYDTRNRLTALLFPDGRGNQAWRYTPDGLPDSITTYNDAGNGAPVVNAYSYNKRRLLVGESVSQPGSYTWGIGYGYDANASLSTQTYPTGLIVNYAPNALGQPTRAGSYATGVQYYPNGAIKQFTYGNGIVHTMTQNARQLPARVIDSGNALDHAYGYDLNGNVAHIDDNIVGTPTLQHRYMQYDGLDRLTGTGSQMFGGDHWHRFTYDALDNLKSWKLAGVKDYADYAYDAKNRLTNIKNSAGATVTGLDYDVQGNLANKNGQLYGFDFGNRLRYVPSKEFYRYDGLGRRVQTTRDDGTQTLWQYGQAGQMLFSHDGPAAQKTHENVYLGGSLVATIDHAWPSNAITAIKYQHTDALGSPVAMTNTTGVVIERTNYEPYGAAINKKVNGIGYTGHVMDGATGLTYMQQRYYDQSIGRFLSVDPVTADSNTGGNFNRYKYANNNPYRFIDPDGRLDWDSVTAQQRMNSLAGAGVGSHISSIVRTPGISDPADEDGNLPSLVSIRTEMRGQNTTLTVNGTTAGEWESKNDVSRRAKPGAADSYNSKDVYPVDGAYKNNATAFGPNDILKTDDVRGRWIHGGGTGLANPSAPEQGWKPTMGCTRMQNNDIQSLVDKVRDIKETFPGLKIPYSRVDE